MFGFWVSIKSSEYKKGDKKAIFLFHRNHGQRIAQKEKSFHQATRKCKTLKKPIKTNGSRGNANGRRLEE